MPKADKKAHYANAYATARGKLPMLAGEPSDTPGFQAWTVGTVLVLMPKLLPGAPASIRRRYRDRIIANATGECPRCHNIAGDPGPGKAIDNAQLEHENWCSTTFGQEIEKWIVPEARGLREAMTWNQQE